MNAAQVFSLLRTVLKFGAGALVAKGVIDASVVDLVISAVLTVGAAGWSYATHKAVTADDLKV
jgi:hypothetical protein